MKIWHVNSSVKIHSLSKPCMKTEQFLLTVRRSLYPRLNIEELHHKAKEKLTSQRIRCGFLLKWLLSGWETVSRVYAGLRREETIGIQLVTSCFRVLLTKIPRKEAKIYHKTNFLSSEGHLLTSPGWCLTLASSLDVEQVKFSSWSVYCVLLRNDLSNLSAVSVLSQKYNACTFRLQK